MIHYNITVKVDHDIHEEWLAWMKQVHIPEVMHTGKFTSQRICRLLGLEEADGITYSIQYSCPDLTTLHRYREEDARRLQEAHREKFRDKYVAFRTVMREV